MGQIASVLIGFITALLYTYVLYWLDRYEKEPLLLLGGVFIWGAVIAAGSAFIINTVLGLGIYIFTNSSLATDIATGSLIAPLVEEILKGLAVLVVFLAFRREFDSILDGIIYAGVVALGFAATENSYYIYTYGFAENGWGGLISMTFIRVILVGWQHPFYTAFFGIGLAVARMNRNATVKVIAPLLGLAMSMFTHAFHNSLSFLLRGAGGLLAGTMVDWSGWLFMLAIIIWSTRREKKNLVLFLAEEVKAGLITPAQYHTTCSSWLQMFARAAAMFSGRYTRTARFFQVCGEYAHKRQQYAQLGEEQGNLAILQQLRTEMAHLAPLVRA